MGLELTTTVEGKVTCYRGDCTTALYTHNKLGVTNLAALRRVAVDDGWYVVATTQYPNQAPVDHIACPDHVYDNVLVIADKEDKV